MAALRRDETSPIHTKNLVIPIAYPFGQPCAGMEPFAIFRIPDRCAWLAGVCVGFPTFLVLLLIREPRAWFGSGRRLSGRWH
jgi:hypothetical protein